MTFYLRGLRKTESGYVLRLPHAFLAFAFLYLVLGNALRVIPTSAGSDNFSAGEFGLYGLTVLCLIFHRKLFFFNPAKPLAVCSLFSRFISLRRPSQRL